VAEGEWLDCLPENAERDPCNLVTRATWAVEAGDPVTAAALLESNDHIRETTALLALRNKART